MFLPNSNYLNVFINYFDLSSEPKETLDRKFDHLIEVDGSEQGGSGTILRLSIALSAITGQPLHIYNIRQNRPQPGLKPQHLEAAITAAKICGAKMKGAEINSHELWFKPGNLESGEFKAEIGTAGSIPMLLMTVLPMCAYTDNTVDLQVSKGGTDVSHSPTINYIRLVFLPVLRRMGLNVALTVHKYGYYPRGNGAVSMTVEPCKSLKPLHLEKFGRVKSLKGVSVCTFLAERDVAKRQAKAANLALAKNGYWADIEIVNDKSNPIQKGSSIVLQCETDTNVIIGADSIGGLRKRSEFVGKEVAERICEEIAAESTVDVHLADLLIPFIALAQGKSTFLTRVLTKHLHTNIWIAEKILDVKFKIQKSNGLYRVEKVE